MTCLRNKVVVITGASSGIGKSASLAFASQGARVVLIARRTEYLEELTRLIRASQGACFPFTLDITNQIQVNETFHQIGQLLGGIDLLINNAGRGLKASLCDIEYHDWLSVIHTNLTGVFLCTKAAVQIMRSMNQKGHIMIVSSIAGRFGAPHYAAYCASKHGVTGFAKSLRWELRKEGIRVSTIYPMRVKTEFFNGYLKKPHPRQMISPEDIARYLVSLSRGNIVESIYLRVVIFLKRIWNFVYHCR